MTDTTQASWTRDDPWVTATISEPDQMAVTVFGLPYTFPPEMGTLVASSFGQVMDHVWGVLGKPFTVEVIEANGARQTGVIDLRPVTDLSPSATPVQTKVSAESSASEGQALLSDEAAQFPSLARRLDTLASERHPGLSGTLGAASYRSDMKKHRDG